MPVHFLWSCNIIIIEILSVKSVSEIHTIRPKTLTTLNLENTLIFCVSDDTVLLIMRD
jgi:hypothetical protein